MSSHNQTVTDELLMRAVQAGHLDALGELFERYHGPAFRFLSRTTGDAALAEDLVQDVFVRILKYRDTYDAASRFDTWLFRIARNARTDHFRKKAPPAGGVDEALEVPASDPGPARQFELQMDARQLERALQLLGNDSRDVLVLARFHDWPYDRIAATLGIDVGAVKVRVHRAIKQLRALYFRLEEETCAMKKTAKKTAEKTEEAVTTTATKSAPDRGNSSANT